MHRRSKMTSLLLVNNSGGREKVLASIFLMSACHSLVLFSNDCTRLLSLRHF